MMLRILSNFLVLLFLLGFVFKANAASFVVAQEATSETLSFKLSTPIEGIKIKDMEQTREVSKAQVPFKAFFIQARPEDLKVVIETGEAQELGTMTLAAYLPRPCRCNEVMQNQFVSASFVHSDPGAFYKLEYLGDLRGIPLTRLTVFPLRLQALQDEKFSVHLYSELKLRVQSENQPVSILNADELGQLSTLGEQKLLIVAPEKLLPSVRTFAEYKKARGIQVETKTFESVGGTKEGLAEFFKASPSFTHVLMIGNETSIPTFYMATEFEAQTPTDLPYFTYGGEGDTIPDVYYGRIASDDAVEVVRILKKSMDFEQLATVEFKNSSGLIGIASSEGQNPSDKQYLEGMLTPLEQVLGLTAVRFHQETPNSTPDNINQKLSAGSYWLNYIGHGSGFSWPSVGSRPYEVADIANIRSAKVLPVIVDVACQNGRFNSDTRLGESFMNAHKGDNATGARAYYGGSVDISWDPPAIMSQGISQFVAKAWTEGRQKTTTVSEAMWAGQLHLMQTFSDIKATTENRIWYHLQGDPTMMLSGN